MSTADYAAVMVAIRATVVALPEFTSDDVWDRLKVIPAERNVVGKGMSEANRLGWIDGTERFVQSRRPEAKGRRIQVWARPAPVSKRDYAKVQIALIRRERFGADVPVPDLDGPAELFPAGDGLAGAVDRHPANGPEEAA